MFRRLFRRIRTEDKLDERVIWGILVPRRTKLAFKILASELRIPISTLLRGILEAWLRQHFENVMTDSVVRAKLAEFLTNEYLRKPSI